MSKYLRHSGLKRHLARTYKVSKDPAFAKKVQDVVGLYLNPPTHAIVLSVDEKTSIKALERTQLPLPLRSGRAVRHTHDYKRHGVVDLFAALEVATGRVTQYLQSSHTGADFLGFMKKVLRQYPDRELHVIMDNSSTHSTPEVQRLTHVDVAGAARQPKVPSLRGGDPAPPAGHLRGKWAPFVVVTLAFIVGLAVRAKLAGELRGGWLDLSLFIPIQSVAFAIGLSLFAAFVVFSAGRLDTGLVPALFWCIPITSAIVAVVGAAQGQRARAELCRPAEDASPPRP